MLTIVQRKKNHQQRRIPSYLHTGAPDDPPQILSCPGDVFRTAPAGAVTLSVTWDEPQATDDNGEVVTIASSTSGDLFVVGTTTSIIYTFMDNAGQTSVCLFNVRIFGKWLA